MMKDIIKAVDTEREIEERNIQDSEKFIVFEWRSLEMKFKVAIFFLTILFIKIVVQNL